MNIFRKTTCGLTLLLILSVAAYTIPKTLGEFAHTIKMSDSAIVSRFDIEVTVPKEFDETSSKKHSRYYFPTQKSEISFDFKVRNNSEVPILCQPYINNGIKFHITIENQVQDKFALGVGEAINFQLVIMSDGLTTYATDANLFIDAQQLYEVEN